MQTTTITITIHSDNAEPARALDNHVEKAIRIMEMYHPEAIFNHTTEQ